MKGSFPACKPDWSNLEVIHRNTLPPRSYFFIYEDEENALAGDTEKACAIKLSGTWKFYHANNPFDAPSGFETLDYDVSSWSDIQVPGMWQLQGHGHPQYTNVNYPIFVDPPNVPFDGNETGCYVRSFQIPQSSTDDQYILRFEGVDSAFHVWINGKEVGYSQGSRNASEFDVTPLVRKDADNILAVQVYQYCDGTYLEDQDQWRFSGIFRDVYLHVLPSAHIRDFHVQTLLDDAYQDSELKVKVDTVGDGPIAIRLIDMDGKSVAEESQNTTDGQVLFTRKVSCPLKWTAETPNLYKLIINFNGRIIVQNVGFRRIEIKNGLYLINGKRIVFRGANRHEHHPVHGRAVPYEFMKQDLLIMKKHNINAIRTCHQPSDPRLYALADELGLWIMDEADLECHGFASIEEKALSDQDRNKPFQERITMISGKAGRYTSDNPDWKEAYVDRARQLVMRDKNHPCVVMWSLGNEAFYGRNFQSMYDLIKSIDDTRPVHYEGNRKAQTVDLFSQMYPTVDSIIEFAKEPNFTKPLVLCEFVHAMGNGPGAIKEYVDAFYEYDRLQGGWIWEWANHGLETRNEDGEEFYAYGGDFGDIPNDYNFILDGALFSDHTPTPGLIEYQKAIQPVQIRPVNKKEFEVVNRYDIIDLDHLKCEATLIADGVKKSLGEVILPKGLEPHTWKHVAMPSFERSSFSGEALVQLDFRLRSVTNWASEGHLVATAQLSRFPPPAIPAQLSDANLIPPRISQPTPSTLRIETNSTTFTFSLPQGKLTSILKFDPQSSNKTELLHNSCGPELTIYRALTDNDRPQDGRDWTSKLVNLAKNHVRGVTWETESSSVTIKVEAKAAPPVFNWSINTTTTYTIYGTGAILIKCKGTPEGMNLPLTLPRIGFEFRMPKEFETVSWFGRGPGESYKDKKLSQLFGNYTTAVDHLWTDYEFPQESSNRTDVRWVQFTASPAITVSSMGKAVSAIGEGIKQLPIIGGLVSSDKHRMEGEEPPKQADSKPPSLTARFGTHEGFSFAASHYETKDVDESTHPYELHKKKKDYVVIRLDANHHGLGTGSCGPKTMDVYALKTEPFEFEMMLE